MESLIIGILGSILASMIYSIFKDDLEPHLQWRAMYRFFSKLISYILRGDVLSLVFTGLIFLVIIFLLVIVTVNILLPWYKFSFQDGRDFISCLLIFLSPIVGLVIFRYIYKYAASEEPKLFFFIAKFLTLAIFFCSIWLLVPMVFQSLEQTTIFQSSLEQKQQIEKLSGIEIKPLSTIVGCLFVGVILELLEKLDWKKNR